jgi:phage terminase large subunit-like protein
VSESSAELLSSLTAEKREAILKSFSNRELAGLEYDWRFWGRPEQFLPPGNWLTWLLLAGRGAGKTRSAAEAIRELVCGRTPLSAGKHSRIALVAETAADARDVMVEGDSGLLAVHPSHFRPLYEPSKRRLTWPNGAIATLYNATEPDQLRGPQHSLAYCDELAKWALAEQTWDMLQFGMRIGDRPQQIIATTPRPIAVLKRIMAQPGTVITRGTTFDNRANLAPTFFSQVVARYAGTRLGRQELNAEILDEIVGALWTRAIIDTAREPRAVPDMQRVVVAVDPSGASGDDESADSIGIVVAGLGIDGRGYILADRTCKLSPAGWGRRAVSAYHEFKADRIVAERNFGGAMVEHVIRTADPNVAFAEVTASRGKVVRAEPVAALYEQGRISHIGDLAELEDQMCQMATDGYLGEGSPDRLDAMVWAITDLMLAPSTTGIIEFYRREVEAKKNTGVGGNVR